MAAISRSRRSAAGSAFIVAGALLLLALLLPLAGIVQPWLAVLAYLGLAAAFGILALGAVNNVTAKIALAAAALGWLLLALGSLIALPAGIATLAVVIAAVGGVVGAIVVYVGKEITNQPALIFVVTTILGALFLLNLIGTLPLGTLGVAVSLLFAAGVLVTGVFFRRTERSRR